MNTRLPILGANGQGATAAEAFHIAMQRQREQQDKRMSLLVHRDSLQAPTEPTDLPEWADELDGERRKDSILGKIAIIFILTTAALGAMAFVFG